LWDKEKGTLTTDLEKMTEAQLEGVVERVVFFDWELDHVGSNSPNFGAYDEDLSGRMVPALLATLKNRERGAAAGRLLGRLRKKTGGKEIEAIARDPKQEGGLRLGALLALHSSGDDLHAAPVIEILDAAIAVSKVEALDPAKEAALKEDSIAALAEVCAADRPAAQTKLVALLDETDVAVRVVALKSLAKFAPAAETARLRKLLFATANLDEARAALRVFEVIKTPESVEALGEFLKSTMEASPFHNAVQLYALSSFGFATGQRWLEAGAHPESYYVAQAKKAVEWWEASRKK
jgi:hypothetical protein